MTPTRPRRRPPRPGTMAHRIVDTLATAPEAELTARQLRIRCGVQGKSVNLRAYDSFLANANSLAKAGLIHHNGHGLYSAMEDA